MAHLVAVFSAPLDRSDPPDVGVLVLSRATLLVLGRKPWL